MNIKTLAISALLATTALVTAPEAQASYRGCYYPSAANAMETMLAGGFTLGEAWEDQVEAGMVTNTTNCWRKTAGYAYQMNLVLPRLYWAVKNHR